MKSLIPLNKYLFRYKWRLFWGVIFVAVSNLFAIIPAQLVRYAFDLVKDTLLFVVFRRRTANVK